MTGFDWLDPFRLAERLSAQERLVRDAARDDAQGKLQPLAAAAFREERFDLEITSEMGAPSGPAMTFITRNFWRRYDEGNRIPLRLASEGLGERGATRSDSPAFRRSRHPGRRARAIAMGAKGVRKGKTAKSTN